MQPFKIKYFERDHPGRSFPRFETLSREHSAHLASLLKPLVDRLFAADPVSGLDANAEAFLLRDVWPRVDVHPSNVLRLSFDEMQSIDVMNADDVNSYFDDIWYPISDNMYVFDDTTSWLILIHHDGYVYCTR